MDSFVIGSLIGPYLLVHAYLMWCAYRIVKWNSSETGVPGVTYQWFALRTAGIAGSLVVIELMVMLAKNEGQSLMTDLDKSTFLGLIVKTVCALIALLTYPPIPDHLRAPRNDSAEPPR